MSNPTIARQIRELIATNAQVFRAEVTDGKRLLDDLGIDTLDRIDLLLSIEDVLHVDLTDDDIESIQTVGDLIAFATRKAVAA
ncbi:MAG: phosphopantetheine-binding protein [Pseudomonadota bacterium]